MPLENNFLKAIPKGKKLNFHNFFTKLEWTSLKNLGYTFGLTLKAIKVKKAKKAEKAEKATIIPNICKSKLGKFMVPNLLF
jgi:hypothetical protein